jgi:catechol 2,3-dioxygenase-like lactoylglutathione lyase family enzyme
MNKLNIVQNFFRGVFFTLFVIMFGQPNSLLANDDKDNSIPKSNSNNSNKEVLMISQNVQGKETIVATRPEHIALNIADPVMVAKWYVNNLNMQIIRQGDAPSYTTFIADSGKHMMFELYHNTNFPLFDTAKVSLMSIHFAFMVSDIEKTKEKIIAAGAKIVEDTKTPSGDYVVMMRDPWGLPIQFVCRVQPMLVFSEYRPEHIALNVEDPLAKAKWFVENFGMKIIRQGDAPTYTTFIADKDEIIMMELYHNTNFPILNLKDIDYMSLHFAYTVDNIESAKEKLICAGATLAEDIKVTQSGDKVLMLRAQWGQALQFVMRQKPMLK